MKNDVSRGEAANRLLEDSEFKAAVEAVREGILSQWSNSPIRDHEGQHELRLMLKLLDDLLANLKKVVDSGKLASIEIERERSLMTKAKAFIKRG